MKTLKEYLSPTAVLTIICVVVTLALAGTYQLTQPVIAANTKAAADAARAEVLPAGGGAYNPVDCKLLDGVIDVYRADNQAEYVITTKDKGFGGAIVAMVGIGADGKIAGVKVLEHSETPGLGTKAVADSHLSLFLGQSRITNTHEAGATNIDAISGATISSNAVFRAVDKAMLQYAELGGAKQNE